MSALSHIDAIRDRLDARLTGPEAEALSRFEAVHTALEFAGDGRRVSQVPAVIVIPVADAGDANRAGHGTLQTLTTTVAVTVIVAARNDPRGERALDDLTPRVAAVREALIGWAPARRHPLRFVRGALVDIEQGRAWWEDVYEYQRFIEALDTY